MKDVNVNLSQVLRTTKKHLGRLEYLHVCTVKDLFFHFPRSYLDRRQYDTVAQLSPDTMVTLKGVISSLNSRRSRNGKFLIQALFTDETGSLEVTWFNQMYLTQLLRPGLSIILSGKVKSRMGRLSLTSPDFELPGSELMHTGRIVPMYHETEGISSKWIREKLKLLWPRLDFFADYLPEKIIVEEDVMPLSEALKQVHFPENLDLLKKARKRLSFDELFLIHLLSFFRKWEWRRGVTGFSKKIVSDFELIKKFIHNLPFTLTNAQKKSLFEILKDLAKDVPMIRLLQGDVGSGKTVIAAIALYSVIRSGFQGIIMAPTEILAKQHFSTLQRFFEPYHVRIALLVGSTKEKKALVESIRQGDIDLVIGTHTLIQEYIAFKNLGLAVIDEQHRFGVEQRDALKKHGMPHLLNMSATPIPRSLAMTLYGDQDVSILDEMPPGRQTIITKIVSHKKRKVAYEWITAKIREGRQVYVICPLIDASDFLEVKSAVQEYEYLSQEVFSQFQVGLLHGKLPSAQKEAVMKDFSDGRIDVLVSTSVVEVGIDVPNSTIMVIEGADRFGLAQLHQFRGRVGRGEHQSYCFLFLSEKESSVDAFEGDLIHSFEENYAEHRTPAKERLEALVRFSDGFKLAEMDLQMRGPGEIYGVRQSGIPDLKMASFKDSELMMRARRQAEKIILKDPELKNFPKLKEWISEYPSS